MQSIINQPQLKYRSYIQRVRGMYQQPVAQTSTALILTLFTISFFGFAAIKPTLATVSQLVGELEEKKIIDQKITRKLEALSSAQDQYLSSQDKLAAFDRAIPAQHNLNQFLLTLEYLAIQNQITLTSIRVDPLVTLGKPRSEPKRSLRKSDQPAPDPFPSYSVRFSADGGFPNLKNYLSTIANLDRVFQIQSASFSQPNDQEQEGQLTMATKLKAFWSPPETQPQ